MRSIVVAGGGERHPGLKMARVRWDGDLPQRLPHHGSAGFTLIEALVSVAIIGLVMGPIFFFLMQVQRRFQANVVVSESNQGARSAMQSMAQEIGQAGFNPQFTASTTSSAAVAPLTGGNTLQCVTLASTTGINPGDYLSVDKGAAFEQVKVQATHAAALSSYAGNGYCTPGANQISAIFMSCHNNTTTAGCPATGILGAFPVASYKFPYASGILQGQTVSYNGSNVSISNDHILAMYYGDSDNSGNLSYVVYSLYNPTASGSLTPIGISGNTYCPAGATPACYIYTLFRSVTAVNFASGQTITHAYPLVDNVIYQDITGSNPVGPTGRPLFNYITTPVTVVPSAVSVVGTVGINVSVAVNPASLEAQNVVQYYTMASQIRPVNLWAAVSITRSGGSMYLPPVPVGLPMAFPSTIANYYF